MPNELHKAANCWCGKDHYSDAEWSAVMFGLHKKIEIRINKLEQPVLGLKGGVSRKEVLKIIEEEFGKLDNI